MITGMHPAASLLRLMANLVWLACLGASLVCWFSATQIENWFAVYVVSELQARLLTSTVILGFLGLGSMVFAIVAGWSEELDPERD